VHDGIAGSRLQRQWQQSVFAVDFSESGGRILFTLDGLFVLIHFPVKRPVLCATQTKVMFILGNSQSI
jgi:hypothetical protein